MAVIIYPPTIDWDWMTQRPQQIMKEFSLHGHEVFYCNKTQLKNTIYSSISENLNIVHNNKLFISKIIPRLKLEKKIIVWVSWPKLYPFVDQYFPDFVVFDYIDDFPSWRPFVKEMVKKGDLIFTSAKTLQEQLVGIAPEKPIYLMHNACNLEDFQGKKENPEFISDIPLHSNKPIITYIGAWAPWVDQDLVAKIALNFPKALILIIGPEFGAKVNFPLNNIKYLGIKPYHSLGYYLSRSNVGIIPFKINQITMATNPVKMYEYLAAGLPVVSTNLPETKNIPYVYSAENTEAFLQQIEHVLNPNFKIDQTELKNWLSKNTWNYRYQEISSILSEEFLNPMKGVE